MPGKWGCMVDTKGQWNPGIMHITHNLIKSNKVYFFLRNPQWNIWKVFLVIKVKHLLLEINISVFRGREYLISLHIGFLKIFKQKYNFNKISSLNTNNQIWFSIS